MAKRNMLVWGDADAGKSTFAASLMAPIAQANGKPSLAPRWPRVHWYNLDKPGVGSIAGYFGPDSKATLFEPSGWRPLADAIKKSVKAAAAGEIDALVVEGLSVYYRDDVGLSALENPDAIEAGGNAMRGLYKAPTMRLEAIIAGMRQISTKAKSPDFLTIITAHSKEIGEDHRAVPDMSRNAWKQITRLCEVVVQLDRQPSKPPKIVYKRREDDLLLARINNQDALAYFDKIHADRNEGAIAQMRTAGGLVALLEHGERLQLSRVAAAAVAQPVTASTET